MARIPFEVSEEQKKEFELRIKTYADIHGDKISSSKILRGMTTLISTMDSFEFQRFLRVINNAERVTEEYFNLLEKYEMEHTFDIVPDWDFYRRYQLLLEIESKRTSKRFVENAVNQDAEWREKAWVKQIHNENSSFVDEIEKNQKNHDEDKD